MRETASAGREMMREKALWFDISLDVLIIFWNLKMKEENINIKYCLHKKNI